MNGAVPRVIHVSSSHRSDASTVATTATLLPPPPSCTTTEPIGPPPPLTDLVSSVWIGDDVVKTELMNLWMERQPSSKSQVYRKKDVTYEPTLVVRWQCYNVQRVAELHTVLQQDKKVALILLVLQYDEQVWEKIVRWTERLADISLDCVLILVVSEETTVEQPPLYWMRVGAALERSKLQAKKNIQQWFVTSLVVQTTLWDSMDAIARAIHQYCKEAK